jgi:hypothetical protein
MSRNPLEFSTIFYQKIRLSLIFKEVGDNFGQKGWESHESHSIWRLCRNQQFLCSWQNNEINLYATLILQDRGQQELRDNRLQMLKMMIEDEMRHLHVIVRWILQKNSKFQQLYGEQQREAAAAEKRDVQTSLISRIDNASSRINNLQTQLQQTVTYNVMASEAEVVRITEELAAKGTQLKSTANHIMSQI